MFYQRSQYLLSCWRVNIFLLILFFITSYAQAQDVTPTTIQVYDGQKRPVNGVVIYNQDKSLSYVTDLSGKVENTAFDQNDRLYFQHPAFEQLEISFTTLQKQHFKIVLSESIVDLSEIVVSANKWEQDKKEVPVKITQISSDEIRLGNPQTAADLLTISNEVFVQKSQLGGGSPMIRGFSTSSVLLVVDGVRMNNAIFRGGNVQNVISLDANAIENTEVIFGPGSVIYGSDALGGVMDFHTKNPKISKDKYFTPSVNALTRYSSANQEKTGHLDFSLGFKKWGFLTSFTRNDYDDLYMGTRHNAGYGRIDYVERINGEDVVIENKNESLQKGSGYSQWNLMQKIRFQPHNRLDINYGFHYSKSSNIPRYDRLIRRRNGNPRYGAWYYGPQKWIMNSLNVKYIQETPFFNQAKLTLGHQNYEESRHDRNFGDDELRRRTEQVQAFNANLDFDKDIRNKGSLFYGFQAVYNKVNSYGKTENIETGSVIPTATRYPNNSDYSTYATYLNYKHNVGEKLTWNAGARYSHILLNTDFTSNADFYPLPFEEINLNEGALTGSIGIVYRPEPSTQLNVNLSSGFRAPNIDDVAKVFDSGDGVVVVPNPELKPEYAYTVDFSVLHTEERVNMEITPFYTFVTNLMVRREAPFNGQSEILYDGELSTTQALVNASEAKIYGMSFTLDGEPLKNIHFKTQLTYSTGETSDGEAIRSVAPLFGSTHILYKNKKLTLDAYTNYNREIAYADLAPSERDKPYLYATDQNGNPYAPSWITWNLKGAYQVNKYLNMALGLENITDNRYRPYSSGIGAPGRNFIIAFRGTI